MRRAIELARSAAGTTSPNPPVGAVLVKDGRVVGEGHTLPPGQGHAEFVALSMAGDEARGADLYVTLEPCAHHGRTPPCADALIAAGVASARIAVMDPAPHTAGRGVQKLRDAGIAVTVDDGPLEARRLIEAFAKHISTGLPLVVVKFAMSLDGKIATRRGDSRWISNEASRREAHRLRSEADAVVVGIGTALADNPLLTARNISPSASSAQSSQPPSSPSDYAPAQARAGNRQPLRVVVDSAGRLPPDSAMLSAPGKTLVAVAGPEGASAARATGADVFEAGADSDGRVDLQQLLAELGARGVASALVEGGSTLHGALFDAGLVDKVVAFVAPLIIGGAGAPGPVAGQGAEFLANALRLDSVEHTELDGDLMLTGRPVR